MANSTFSRPRAISPAASDSTLPCSAVMIAASSGVRCVQQLAEREQDRRALRQRGVPPLAGRRRRAGDGGVELLGRGQVDLAGDPRRWPGCTPGPCARSVPSCGRPSIQCEMRVVMTPPYDSTAGNTIQVLLWYKHVHAIALSPRGAPRPPHRQGPGPRRVRGRSATARSWPATGCPRSAPSPPSSPCPRPRSAPPGPCSARAGTVATDGRRGTTVLDQRAGRRRPLPAGARAPGRLRRSTCRPASPTPTLLPEPQPPRWPRLTSTPTTGQLPRRPGRSPSWPRRCRRDWPHRRRRGHRRRRRHGRPRPGRADHRCGSATGSSSRTRASPRWSTCSSRSAPSSSAVPVDDEGLSLAGLSARPARAGRRGLPAAPRPEPDRRHHDRRRGPAPSRGCSTAPQTLVVEDDSAAGLSADTARQPGQLAPRPHGARPLVLQVARTRTCASRRCQRAGALIAGGQRPPPARAGLVQPAAAAGAARPADRRRRRRARWPHAAADVCRAAGRRGRPPCRERGVEVGGTEGINIWVPVHDETAAVVRLASQGIGVAPGAPFRVGPPDGAGARPGHRRAGPRRLRRAGRRDRGRGPDHRLEQPGALTALGAGSAPSHRDRDPARPDGTKAGLQGCPASGPPPEGGRSVMLPRLRAY